MAALDSTTMKPSIKIADINPESYTFKYFADSYDDKGYVDMEQCLFHRERLIDGGSKEGCLTQDTLAFVATINGKVGVLMRHCDEYYDFHNDIQRNEESYFLGMKHFTRRFIVEGQAY